MKPRHFILLILLVIPLGAVALAQDISPVNDLDNDWKEISDLEDGIHFQKFRLTDPVPVNIFVARMNRDNPNVIIDSAIAQGRLSGGLETVSGMADRYDQALNNWDLDFTPPVTQTWGSRNDVVVAINGFFYGSPWEASGVPWSGQIQSGWYGKRFYDFRTDTAGSGFAWRYDRSVFIGGCVKHVPDKQFVDFAGGPDEVQYINAVNAPRENNELILYTPQYDRNTKTINEGISIEVLVQMNKPTMIISASEIPVGIVQEIRDNPKGFAPTPIPFDHIVLSAHGTAAEKLRANIKLGDKIGINQKIKHFLQDNCSSLNSESWENVYSSIAGSYYFLRNENGESKIYDFSHEGDATHRQPRTALAYNDNYIFFIVADGRDPGISEGMTVAEMAGFVKNTLNATEAIMQDGGGSSTMAIKNYHGSGTFDVVNNTFCNDALPHCTHVYLPQVISSSDNVTKSSQNQFSLAESDQLQSVEAQTFQRWVANGMMMVVVEPISQSGTFTPGDYVATTAETSLRLGPGTNYGVLSPLPVGAAGDVVQNTKGLDGVLAKGAYWWQVKVGNTTGWIAEDFLMTELKSAPAEWRQDDNPLR